jgi:hypothetical protein
MKAIYIPEMTCQWCKGNNDFTYGDPGASKGWIYDLDNTTSNAWQCNKCGHLNQVVVDLRVVKYEPNIGSATIHPGLKPEVDVMFADKGQNRPPSSQI